MEKRKKEKGQKVSSFTHGYVKCNKAGLDLSF